MSYIYVILRDYNGYTTRDNLYIILERKEQVVDDVVDVIILMIHEELLTNPLTYKKYVVVTQP